MPKKKLQGIVVSDKMQKTVVVKVARHKLHPRFKVYYRSHKKYKAHDEKNECRVGDWVIIEETRPLSKEKRWRVVEIIRRREKEQKEEKKQEAEKEQKKELVKNEEEI